MNILFQLFGIMPLLLGDCAEIAEVTRIEYNRYANVVSKAWQDCRIKIMDQCKNLGVNKFCPEPYRDLGYDELERLKPQEECEPMKTSLNKLCQLLFLEKCLSINTRASMASTATQTAFCSVLSLISLFPFLRVVY